MGSNPTITEMHNQKNHRHESLKDDEKRDPNGDLNMVCKKKRKGLN